MSTKQTLEERLKKTVMAMRRTEPDSGIDLCHIVAVEEAIDRIAKFAAFAGPDGEPRKVLGTLPVTADGCFIGMGATVYGGPYGKNGGRISDEALLDADSEREAETAILPDGRGLEVGISPFSLWPKGSPRKPRLYSSYAALDAAKEQP